MGKNDFGGNSVADLIRRIEGGQPPREIDTTQQEIAATATAGTATGSRSKAKAAEVAPFPSLADLFAPEALDFKADRLMLGQQHARVMVITDFPSHVAKGWLGRLFTLPGVVASMHILPTDPAELLKKINSGISEFTARLMSGGRNALLNQRTEQSLRDAQELLRMVDQEQQKVWTVCIVLLILADDEQELAQRTKRVEAVAIGAALKVRTVQFQQQEGLTAAGPWAWITPAIRNVAPRHMPSETIAGAIPFVGGSVNHGSGTLMGHDATGGLTIINRWNPPSGLGVESPNMCVLAMPRAGKSFAIKLLSLREYQLGSRLIFIDPEREYKGICEKLGGTWIDAAGGSRGVINPFQVRPLPLDPGQTQHVVSSRLSSPLAQQCQRLRTFFDLYLRDLTDFQRSSLEDAILALYEKFGVKWDTDPARVTRWPNMQDLYEELKLKARLDGARWEQLAIYLRPAAEGIDSTLWCGAEDLPDAEILVLDVHNLNNLADNVKRAQYFNVLTYTWDLIRRDRQNEKKMLVVDEAWFLADPRVPAALDFLREMSKRIPKYKGTLTVISQNIVDFLAPEVARHGEAIISNCGYKLFLRQGERDLEVISRLLSLSEGERELLATARRGEGLFVAGNQRVHLKIKAAPYELEIIDPDQAALLRHQR